MNGKFDRLFSIVTACRNAEAIIEVTARSVLAQTFPAFEWIVIDGDSTDGTLLKLEPFRKRITHLVCEPDDGIYDAMNKGLLLATGRFVIFLNAGDWLADGGVLNDVSMALKAAAPVLLHGRVRMLDPRSGYTKTLGEPFSWRRVAFGLFPMHPGCFFDRQTLLNRGGFRKELRIAADLDATLQIIADGGALHFLERDITIFPMVGVSSRMDWSFRSLREQARVIRRHAPIGIAILHSVRTPLAMIRRVVSHALDRIGLLSSWRNIKCFFRSNS